MSDILDKVKVTNSGYLRICEECTDCKQTLADLPTEDVKINTRYFVYETELYYTWNGTEWIDTGGEFDLGGSGGGSAPTITIGDNGNWFIDGVDTGQPSRGEQGEKGDKGETGEQGLQGEQGLPGDKGDKGDTGEKGEKGEKGDPGEIGKTGAQGVSVSSIKQTTTSTADGGTNVITATLSNGTMSTFNIKNGSKGSKGDKGDKGDPGSDATVTVDSALSSTSKNPVQNKVVNNAITLEGEYVANSAGGIIMLMTGPELIKNVVKCHDNVIQNLAETIRGNVDDIWSLFADFAPTYSNTSTYKMGDFVIYNGSLYRCISAITSGESFNSTKWRKKDYGTEINKLFYSPVHVANFNDAPYVVCSGEASCLNNPFPQFWTNVITIGGVADSYRQQLAFSLASSNRGKFAYRVCDNGTWYEWEYIKGGNVQAFGFTDSKSSTQYSANIGSWSLYKNQNMAKVTMAFGIGSNLTAGTWLFKLNLTLPSEQYIYLNNDSAHPQLAIVKTDGIVVNAFGISAGTYMVDSVLLL